jgi:hypothetical protein
MIGGGNVDACYPTQQGTGGFSSVLPANVEQLNGVGIVQLGVAMSSCAPAPTSCPYLGDTGGRLKFAFTAKDGTQGGNTPGALSIANWANGGTAYPGHTYTFYVWMSGSLTNNPLWNFKVLDEGTEQIWTTTIHRTWGNSFWGYNTTGSTTGRRAWWGFETGDYRT